MKECRNRPENPINRKRTIFCFETTPPKNSERKKNSRKNPSEKKIFLKMTFLKKISTSKKNLKKSQLRKKINWTLMFFFRNDIFSKIFFFGWIFSTIFFRLRIFWGCSFDAEIGPLSTYEVFRAIPALLHPVSSRFRISFFFMNSIFFLSKLRFP